MFRLPPVLASSRRAAALVAAVFPQECQTFPRPGMHYSALSVPVARFNPALYGGTSSPSTAAPHSHLEFIILHARVREILVLPAGDHLYMMATNKLRLLARPHLDRRRKQVTLPAMWPRS